MQGVVVPPLSKGDFFMRTNSLEKTKKLVTVALFCALAFIGMNFRINVAFLSYDLKDAFITIGAMFLGPIAGITMSAIVALLEFITISDTGVYGLIMNFISSAVFALVAPLIYKYRRKLSGAVIGLLCSVITTVVIMMAANLLITPYYMGVTIDDVIGLIPTLLLPFNAVKCVLNASLVLLLYKPTTTALRASGLLKKPATSQAVYLPKKRLHTIIVVIVSLIVIAACLTVFFVFMSGSVEFTKS